MLSIVESFGIEQGDKVILNKKSIEMALTQLKNISKTMEKMSRRGGIVLVKDGDIDITTYWLDSFSIGKKNRNLH
jgi:ASC-1-like (ASCH) protein